MKEEKKLNQNKMSEFDENNNTNLPTKAENIEVEEPANIDSTVDIVMKQYDEVIKDLVDL